MDMKQRLKSIACCKTPTHAVADGKKTHGSFLQLQRLMYMRVLTERAASSHVNRKQRLSITTLSSLWFDINIWRYRCYFLSFLIPNVALVFTFVFANLYPQQRRHRIYVAPYVNVATAGPHVREYVDKEGHVYDNLSGPSMVPENCCELVVRTIERYSLWQQNTAIRKQKLFRQ